MLGQSFPSQQSGCMHARIADLGNLQGEVMWVANQVEQDRLSVGWEEERALFGDMHPF